jgi:hypothetical protein
VDIWYEGINASLADNPLLLPIIVGVCALISGLIQHGGGKLVELTEYIFLGHGNRPVSPS